MNCERADLLMGLLGGDDDVATPEERAEAERHVASCDACRDALAAYRSLSRAVRELPPEKPSAEATARAYTAVIDAMRGATEKAPRLKLLEGGRSTGARDDGRAWRRPGPWLQGVAAAACLLLVVALAFGPDPRHAGPATAKNEASVQEAPAAGAASSADVPAPTAPARQAPPVETAPTAPPEGAPGSTGRLRDETPRPTESPPTASSRDADAAEDRGAAGAGAPAELDEELRAAGEKTTADDDRDATAEREEAAAAAAEALGEAERGLGRLDRQGGLAQLARGADVIGAWRVKDRVLVLERTPGSDAVTVARLRLDAHEVPGQPADGAPPASEPDARRASRPSGEVAGPRAPAPPPSPPTARPEPPSARGGAPALETDVAPVAPDVALRLRARDPLERQRDEPSKDEDARQKAVTFDEDLRAILAMELRGPRDGSWPGRVGAVLRALGQPAAGDATVADLERRARAALAPPAEPPPPR